MAWENLIDPREYRSYLDEIVWLIASVSDKPMELYEGTLKVEEGDDPGDEMFYLDTNIEQIELNPGAEQQYLFSDQVSASSTYREVVLPAMERRRRHQ